MLTTYPYPWISSDFTYGRRLVESFNYVLSPQRLPQNVCATHNMDEELWMPIRVLAKLPDLDRLFINDLSLPYVTELLRWYGHHTLEVDTARQMIRPKWACRSSVFISSVDEKATPEQIFTLLSDVRRGTAYPNGPFEYHNVSIIKQSPTSWTIGFKSPSAGPYAAMALRRKCINGRMILPMACVHINPPRAQYSSVGIAVMEVDVLEYGDPIVPPNLVQYYSENPYHLSMMYNIAMCLNTMPQQEAPGYQAFYQGTGIVEGQSLKSAKQTPSELSAESESWYPPRSQSEPSLIVPGPSSSESLCLGTSSSHEDEKSCDQKQLPKDSDVKTAGEAQSVRASQHEHGSTDPSQISENPCCPSQVQEDAKSTSEANQVVACHHNVEKPPSEEGIKSDHPDHAVVFNKGQCVSATSKVAKVCSNQEEWDIDDDCGQKFPPQKDGFIDGPCIETDTDIKGLACGSTSHSSEPSATEGNKMSSTTQTATDSFTVTKEDAQVILEGRTSEGATRDYHGNTQGQPRVHENRNPQQENSRCALRYRRSSWARDWSEGRTNNDWRRAPRSRNRNRSARTRQNTENTEQRVNEEQ